MTITFTGYSNGKLQAILPLDLPSSVSKLFESQDMSGDFFSKNNTIDVMSYFQALGFEFLKKACKKAGVTLKVAKWFDFSSLSYSIRKHLMKLDIDSNAGLAIQAQMSFWLDFAKHMSPMADIYRQGRSKIEIFYPDFECYNNDPFDKIKL